MLIFEQSATVDPRVLESVRRICAKQNTPWMVRDFENAADGQGRTPLHCVSPQEESSCRDTPCVIDALAALRVAGV